MATSILSLSEQVEGIKNGILPVYIKRQELLKLGITDYEIQIILPSSTRHTLTFGVEMETYGANKSVLLKLAHENKLPIEFQGYNHIDSRKIFKFVHDGSISGKGGIECVTPILKGRKGFAALEKACFVLNEAGAKVNRSTGLHVHIGAESLTDEEYCNVFVNYQMLEYVIDFFMAKSRRYNDNYYCRSLLYSELEFCKTRYDIYRAMRKKKISNGEVVDLTRYYKVNPCSYSRHKTIEFRQHQGSTDFTKIKAWVNFCAKLVTWSLDNRLMPNQVTCINEIPFLTAAEKAYFNSRKEQLANLTV